MLRTVLSVLPIVSAVETQGAGPFFTGFAQGLLGDVDGVQHCAKDLGKVSKAGMSLAHDAMNRDVNKTVSDIQHLFNAFHGSIEDCKDAVGDLKPFLHALDGVHGPGDLYQKLKKNGLDNDEAIVDAFEGAGKYCTFRAPDGKKCGQSLGRPMRLILLGSQSLELESQGAGAFLTGFAQGLLGDSDGVQHCAKDLGKVSKAGMRLVNDAMAKNVNKSVSDIQKLFSAFQSSIADCKEAVGELKPFLQILDGVKGPADLYKKLKKNGLDNDEAIVDAFEGAGKYCTFRSPDGNKCGQSLGRPVRLILLGSPTLELESQGAGAFVSGFAQGLLGDSDGVQHCAKDLGKVSKAGMSLVQDAMARNINKTVSDIQHLLKAFQGSIVDCKEAVGELKPFLHIIDGVNGPADLYKKLKKNGLDNDEEIVEAFEGAGKYCTFRSPDGHKCGQSLGRPIRIILLGSTVMV